MPSPLVDSFYLDPPRTTVSSELSDLPLHRSPRLPENVQSSQVHNTQEAIELHNLPPQAQETIVEFGHSEQQGSPEIPPLHVEDEQTFYDHQVLPEIYSSSFDSDSSIDSQMGQQDPLTKRRKPERPKSVTTSQNGHANGNMNNHVEMRRKNPSLDSPTAASQTAHLMSRESFSLNDEPPPTPITSNSNTSFFNLPRQDRRNFLLLVLLYFLQGIPMGLAAGSVPFLLKSHLSYGQLGVFSLASYPYSLKLLWAPIVDAVWNPSLGRRKSWILPIQMFSGLGMLYLGSRIKEMVVAAGASDGSGVWSFTWWWFFLVFLCATQDIAVDGTFEQPTI